MHENLPPKIEPKFSVFNIIKLKSNWNKIFAPVRFLKQFFRFVNFLHTPTSHVLSSYRLVLCLFVFFFFFPFTMLTAHSNFLPHLLLYLFFLTSPLWLFLPDQPILQVTRCFPFFSLLQNSFFSWEWGESTRNSAISIFGSEYYFRLEW